MYFKKIKKEVGITIKSKETLYRQHLMLFIQMELQLSSYVHACKNEIHFIANLQDLKSTLGGITMCKQQ